MNPAMLQGISDAQKEVRPNSRVGHTAYDVQARFLVRSRSKPELVKYISELMKALADEYHTDEPLKKLDGVMYNYYLDLTTR